MKKSKTHLMTLYVSFLLGMLLSFSSCEKIDVPKGTPKCIKQRIKEEVKNNSCLEKVYDYDYNGQKVYFFVHYNCPDAADGLLDEHCNRICSFGGISGQGSGSCPNFYQERKNEKLIWQK